MYLFIVIYVKKIRSSLKISQLPMQFLPLTELHFLVSERFFIFQNHFIVLFGSKQVVQEIIYVDKFIIIKYMYMVRVYKYTSIQKHLTIKLYSPLSTRVKTWGDSGRTFTYGIILGGGGREQLDLLETPCTHI